jgi:hypothetical protein
VRAECLDWLLIVNRRHLERVLRVYVDHYNRKKAPPRTRPAAARRRTSNAATRQLGPTRRRRTSRSPGRPDPRIQPRGMKPDLCTPQARTGDVGRRCGDRGVGRAALALLRADRVRHVAGRRLVRCDGPLTSDRRRARASTRHARRRDGRPSPARVGHQNSVHTAESSRFAGGTEC